MVSISEKDQQRGDQARVAVIGTGLAGLTTAWLLTHDDRSRFNVTLFEQVRASCILTQGVSNNI